MKIFRIFFNLCCNVAQAHITFVSSNKNSIAMKNNDFNLSSLFQSEASFTALVEIMDDLGFEVTAVRQF